jgi:hypothetical protein
MKDRESKTAIIIIILAILLCYWSYRHSLWSEGGPGDGLFFGLLLLIQGIRNPQAERAVVGEGKDKAAIYIGSLIAYGLLFQLLGFILTSVLFMLVICKWAERAGWKASLMTSALSTASLYIIFHLMEVPFPLGVLNVFSFLWAS